MPNKKGQKEEEKQEIGHNGKAKWELIVYKAEEGEGNCEVNMFCAFTEVIAYSVCFFFSQPIHLGHLILLCFTKVEKFYSLLIGALAISESTCNFYRNIPVMMPALLHSTLSHTHDAGMLYWSAGSSSSCSASHLASY